MCNKKTKCKVFLNEEDSFCGRDYKMVEIDACLAGIVNYLNSKGHYTKYCCCGHFRKDGYILLQDGTRIVIKNT